MSRVPRPEGDTPAGAAAARSAVRGRGGCADRGGKRSPVSRPGRSTGEACPHRGEEMAETFEAYRIRVLGYLGDRDPVRVQQATPARLERLLGGLPRRALTRRLAPGKWSVIEILAHLADAELAMGWRLRNMLATPGARLPWWDEHLWSEKCQYARSSPRRSVATFRALRESNLALLRSVPREVWDACHGLHDTRGRQTVAEFVRLEAAHDLNHLRQIERLLRSTANTRPAPSVPSRQVPRRQRRS